MQIIKIRSHLHHRAGRALDEIVLDDATLLDTEGFRVVYVFPYPEPVMIFAPQRDAA